MTKKPNLRHEKRLWRQGYSFVAGVDEVGRGAWAGPLVAVAVVILPSQISADQTSFSLVRDSKKLSPHQREKIFNQLSKNINWTVGVVSNQEIDNLGLSKANRLAIERAVKKLKPAADYILTDYVAGQEEFLGKCPVKNIINGDAGVFSIALASIMAKVYRDRLMINLDKKYPGYDLAQNKGYGTSRHIKNLELLGPCKLHRLTYRPLRQRLL